MMATMSLICKEESHMYMYLFIIKIISERDLFCFWSDDIHNYHNHLRLSRFVQTFQYGVGPPLAFALVGTA